MYPLTKTRLNILVKSFHSCIKHIDVNNSDEVFITIKLRWWCRKKRFMRITFPEIKETIERIKPIDSVVKYEIK